MVSGYAFALELRLQDLDLYVEVEHVVLQELLLLLAEDPLDGDEHVAEAVLQLGVRGLPVRADVALGDAQRAVEIYVEKLTGAAQVARILREVREDCACEFA